MHARVLQRHRRLRRQPGQQIEIALVERDRRRLVAAHVQDALRTSLPKIIGACIDSPPARLASPATSGADKIARPFARPLRGTARGSVDSDGGPSSRRITLRGSIIPVVGSRR